MASAIILVVDDDPIHLKLTRILLSSKGYGVETAETGGEAIEMAQSVRPALIVTDYQLPDIDGLELTRCLKADAATRDIPVVLISTITPTLGEREAREAGCLGFLTKPIRTQTFASQIGRFLLQAQADALSNGVPVSGAKERPLVLIVNDDPAERMILEQRMAESGFATAVAHNGIDGLAAARRSRPGVIISDVLMPEMDGFQFCQAVRADSHLQRIPFVLTTSGSIQKNDELMAKTIGANAFVLRTHEMIEVCEAARSSMAAGAPKSSRLDPTVLDSLCQYFLEEGERQTLRLLDQLSTGVNRNAVRRLAHRWAGVAGTFGHPRISEISQQLELITQRTADPVELRPVLLELSETFMHAVGRK